MKGCRPEQDNATGVAVRLWGVGASCLCGHVCFCAGESAGRGPCARRRIFHFFPRIFLSFRFSRERVIVFLINTQCVLIILYRHMMPVTRVDQCEVNNWLLAYRVNAIIPKLVK
jgi:hypothetical protein